MYSRVASFVAVSTGAGGPATEVSLPVALEGVNSVQVDATVLSISSLASLDVVLQVSNDMENWTDRSTVISSIESVGHFVASAQTVSESFARLKYTITGTSETAVLAAGLNSSRQ